MKRTAQSQTTSFVNLDLSKFTPVIKNFWKECEIIEQEYKDMWTGIRVPEHDKKTINIINKLKTIPTWKANLFILSLKYSTSELAEMLNVKKGSLSVYMCEIRKLLR